MKLRIACWILPCAILAAVPAHAQLVLVEEGGVFDDTNLAHGPGAFAFAIDSLEGFPIHDVAGLNDGVYGNANSWIGNSGEPGFAAIALGGGQEVSSIAFGRDNQEVPQFNDRYAGVYTLQYTTALDPDESTPDDQWVTIGSAENGATCPSRPWMRHRYNFPPVEATALRLLVPGTGLAGGTAIDELEVYSEPGEMLTDPCPEPLPELELLLVGGPGSTPAAGAPDVATLEEGNFARAPDAIPFGTPPHPAPVHEIQHLNDGSYGNSNSWLGNEPGFSSGKVYAGIYFSGGLRRLEEIALGRDNLGMFPDRAAGAYRIEYTMEDFDAADDASADGAEWIPLGQASAHLGDGSPNLRRVYGFAPVEARAVRVITALGNAIDEIELGGKLSEIEREEPPPPPPLPHLTLVEVGGTLTDENLAQGPGAFAFAIDSLEGFPIHDVAGLNDGIYGNANSWIGNSGNPGFAGIHLGGSVKVSSIAFGRDNQEIPQFNDRYLGRYVLQITTSPDADEMTPEESWTSIREISNSESCPPRPWMRHRYNFPEVEATAIRLLVPATGLAAGTAIDELEVYSEPGDEVDEPCVPPEPLELIATGGPGATPANPEDVPSAAEGNLARLPSAIPFGTPPHPAPVHEIPHLNDGFYGNSQSWLGNEPGPSSGKVYAGIYFEDGPHAIRGIALGRDNTGVLTDRAAGPHVVEYTRDAFDPADDASIDAAGWIVLGLADGHLQDGMGGLRHAYAFPVVDARAVRILTTLGNAIDEIELLEAGAGPVLFHRGDPDSNGRVEITDAVVILGFLFLGQSAPSCLEAADADDNGSIEITDAVVILGYLFLGGRPPAPPGPEEPCGPDPAESPANLGCETYTNC